LRQGGKTVEKRHRVVRRAGAVVEAACSISANPYYSVQRFYRVSEARDAPDRDQLWFPGLEHCRLVGRCRAEPARRRRGSWPFGKAGDTADPNSGIFPLTGCPGRRNGTSAERSRDEIRLQVEGIGGLTLAVAAGPWRLLRIGDDMKFSAP